MRLQSRAGFTLIELMVAMALTLLIMAILSQAFVMALDTFSGLKGIGDMQQQQRTASVLLRSDLASNRMEGSRRLSDPNINLTTDRIQAGFFVVRQGSAPSASGPGYVDEGSDQNAIPSFRAVDHCLYFTVKRRGNRQEDFFSTVLAGNATTLNKFFMQSTAYGMPPGALSNVTLDSPYPAGATQWPYASQWAEVLYYLERTGSTEEPSVPNSPLGTPTFALKRAQFLLVPDAARLNTPANAADKIANTEFAVFSGFACNPGTSGVDFYTPASAALGQRTINPAAFVAPQPPLSAPPTTVLEQQLTASSTLLLPNVISFQVQIMPTNGTAFIDVPGGVFDSTTATLGIKAIQITLRVWDKKTRQTRQTTIMQDL